MTAPIRYACEQRDALRLLALDDIMLVYHRPSQQTHMVISPVPEILAAMGDGAALDAAALHARLAVDYDLGPPGEAVAELDAHLAALAALGLVRPQ